MLLTTVYTDMVLIPLWLRQDSMYPHVCSQIVCGSSLYCSNFGLEADECSVCPIAEELEVLKKLMTGLQDIELIGKVRGEGRGCRSQLWCVNSLHLWRRQADKQIRKIFIASYFKSDSILLWKMAYYFLLKLTIL